MNNQSGSALQKANFVLLALILAGLAYLIVRERVRSEQRAEAEAAEVAEAKARAVSAAPSSASASELKSSFTPLRDRVQTNVTRVVTAVTNRVPVVLRTNYPGFDSAEPQPVVAAATPVIVAGAPVAAAISPSPVGGGGSSVAGHVVLRGTPPPEKVITLDATCGAFHNAPLTTRHYLVSDGGALANVFVYLKAGAPKVAPPTGMGPLLDQVGCVYQPYVMGVQAGQTFKVRNSDPVLHNVHSLAKNPGNKERNVGQPIKGMVTPFVFATPEVFVQFKCEVHPWMFAYVGVVDHPWFGITDQNGNFALPVGLPPGQYTLAAVHLKAGELLQPINVGTDGAAPVTFTFDVPTGAAGTNPPRGQ